MIDDPPTTYKQANYLQFTYFLANQIESSPMTEEVKNIWYTPEFRSVPFTQALKVDASWKVVVFRNKTALTQPITWDPPESAQPDHKVVQGQPATYATSPPLVADKEMGKGRIVLMAFSAMNTVFGYKHPFYEDIAYDSR